MNNQSIVSKNILADPMLPCVSNSVKGPTRVSWTGHEAVRFPDLDVIVAPFSPGSLGFLIVSDPVPPEFLA